MTLVGSWKWCVGEGERYGAESRIGRRVVRRGGSVLWRWMRSP
jgi:hypothetical protein